jgi:hypothetical protein
MQPQTRRFLYLCELRFSTLYSVIKEFFRFSLMNAG